MTSPALRLVGATGKVKDGYETHGQRNVAATTDQVWAVIETIGGRNGFFSWPLAWAVRAELDQWAGGPGFAQHRAHPGRLTPGDTIDFLTVTAVEPGRFVQFATDRWSPGVGALEVWVDPDPPGGGAARSILHLRATWQPDGLIGDVYWLALKPFHLIIFPEMLRRIGELAEQG